MSDSSEKATARLGVLWSSLVLALAPVAATLVLAPARSGPFCVEDCVTYPFADIAHLYPAEYWWMYVMIVAAFALIALGAASVSLAPVPGRALARMGNGFAILSGTTLAICYFIQIEVIQPSVLAGETEGIAVLTQYNAHGVFIALEDLGYLALALALAGLTAGLKPLGRLFAAAFWVALCGAVLVVGTFLFISIVYGVGRSYYFEVAAILVDWIAMLVVGGLLALASMRMTRRSLAWRKKAPEGDA
ncbi:MAG: hypothetical protein KKH72_14890 [Alphaproteobacteria bacterium]|nr:hypothetical protein [Alphaproteobacteria bacterium]